MKRSLILLVLIGITIILWMYMILSGHKHKTLVNDIINLESRQLSSISEQAINIKYRYSLIIADGKVTSGEITKISYLLEEFRNIILPYSVLSHLNETQSNYAELNTIFENAFQSLSLDPNAATVSEIEHAMDVLDTFAKSVLVMKDRTFGH